MYTAWVKYSISNTIILHFSKDLHVQDPRISKNPFFSYTPGMFIELYL